MLRLLLLAERECCGCCFGRRYCSRLNGNAPVAAAAIVASLGCKGMLRLLLNLNLNLNLIYFILN